MSVAGEMLALVGYGALALLVIGCLVGAVVAFLAAMGDER